MSGEGNYGRWGDERSQCFDSFDGLFETLVVVAHNAIIVFDAEEVASNERLDHVAEIYVAMVVNNLAAFVLAYSFVFEFLDKLLVGQKTREVVFVAVGMDSVEAVFYQGASLVVHPLSHPFAFNIAAGDIFGSGIFVESLGDGERIVIAHEGVESSVKRVVAVVIGPSQGEGVESASRAEGEEIVGEANCVDRYKDIGHDATAAIDDAAFGGVVFERVGVGHRVGRAKLTHFVAFLQFVVVGVGTLVVRFLNASSRGGVVASCGEADLSSVVDFEHSLHQTLAEGAATDEGATIPILNGARDNLGCRRGIFVDKDYQRARSIASATTGDKILSG